jgi:hypothetical protein
MSAQVKSITPAIVRRDVERAAHLAALIREATTELDAIKAKYKDAGDGEYLGREHKLIVSTTSRTTLDSAEVKARLSPADYAQCLVTNEVTSVRIKEV